MDVRAFYEAHPYPPPADDLGAYRKHWDDRRRSADSYFFWPSEPYRDDRSILVAGCGTVQAAHYAVRWPNARVVGIDFSETSISYERALKRAYALDNLELRLLPLERACELNESFEHIVCTGVLHHLSDPDAGLRALREVLQPNGAVNLMVYAKYGRTGIYMLQEYCSRLGIVSGEADLRDLASVLKTLPPDHPLVPLLRSSRDFATPSGLADALLNPRDRAYTVPQLMDLLDRCGFSFGRWIRQAPYLPWCGSLAKTPHASNLIALSSWEQYAAIELFRGTMVRHSCVVYRDDAAEHPQTFDFESDGWLRYVPVRLPDTVVVRDSLPPGAAAVLINRSHTYTDLYLPIDAREEGWLAQIDGERTIEEICGAAERIPAREFFQALWRWDQVTFNTLPRPRISR